jgi:hypothetical protein
MDGQTQKQPSFFTGEMSPKREIIFLKIRKYSNFGGFSSPEVRFFFFFGGVQIARFQ